jgi:flagellar biosynthesis protein FliQ
MEAQLDEALLQMMYLLGYGLGIPLALLLVTGLFLAILQSATQVQEQLLVFFPKILLGSVLIYFGGNSFLSLSSEYLRQMILMLRYVH